MGMFIGLAGAFVFWAGGLVCGFRAPLGFEETPLTRRIAVPKRQRKSVGNGAETIRSPRLGDDTFARLSVLEWNDETAVLQVERANSANEASTGRRR